MFGPRNKFAGGARVGFEGCESCGSSRNAGAFGLVGIDATPAPPPWGVEVGVGTDFPNQSGNVVSDNAPGVFAFLMTFTPRCPVEVSGLFIDPQFAADMELQAAYLGYHGYQNRDNLLGMQGPSNGALPALMFASMDVTVPLFATDKPVIATANCPLLIVGQTRAQNASITLWASIWAKKAG